MMKRRKLAYFMTLMILVLSFSNRYAEAKTKVVKISSQKLIAGEQFFMDGCPSTVQNFAYSPDGKYVFASGTNTRICLLKMPEQPGPDAVAEFLDAKDFDGYGHGDTIEVSQPDKSKEVYDLWTCKRPGKSGYGRDLVRIRLAVEDGKMVIKKKIILNNFIKTNVIDGKACYYEWNPTLERVDVSVDEKNNQIVFRVGCYTCINYLAYDYKKLTKALNKVPDNGKYDMSKAAKWQQANLRSNLVPNISIQGFCAIDHTIYVCGGHLDRGAGIYAIKYKVYKNGKAVQQDKYEEKYIDVNYKLSVSNEDEIEGIKIKRNKKGGYDIHVGFYSGDDEGVMGKTIYKFEVKKQ